jgi:hypothetical protein
MKLYFKFPEGCKVFFFVFKSQTRIRLASLKEPLRVTFVLIERNREFFCESADLKPTHYNSRGSTSSFLVSFVWVFSMWHKFFQ